MAFLTADLTALPVETRNEVINTVRNDNAAKLALAKVRQAHIAKLHRDAVRPGTTKDGFGPLSLAIDPYFVNYFRIQHGAEIFSDDEFIKFLKKRGEWFHVPEMGTRVQIGWTAQSKVKERKVYA